MSDKCDKCECQATGLNYIKGFILCDECFNSLEIYLTRCAREWKPQKKLNGAEIESVAIDEYKDLLPHQKNFIKNPDFSKGWQPNHYTKEEIDGAFPNYFDSALKCPKCEFKMRKRGSHFCPEFGEFVRWDESESFLSGDKGKKINRLISCRGVAKKPYLFYEWETSQKDVMSIDPAKPNSEASGVFTCSEANLTEKQKSDLELQDIMDRALLRSVKVIDDVETAPASTLDRGLHPERYTDLAQQNDIMKGIREFSGKK